MGAGTLAFTDGVHPAIDVGNRPPCLFGGVTVTIDPISIKVWNITVRRKATITLYTN